MAADEALNDRDASANHEDLFAATGDDGASAATSFWGWHMKYYFDQFGLDLSYNPEKAKELVAELGDNTTLHLMVNTSSSDYKIMAEVIQEQCRQVGVTIIIDEVDFAGATANSKYGAFGNPNTIAHLAGLIEKLYHQPVPEKPDRKTTYNVGTIQGGTSVNTIAQDVQMTYEYRSDDLESLVQMREQFHELVNQADCPDAHFELELLGERPCGSEVPEEPHNHLLTRCSQVIAEVTGITPGTRASSTDANIPLSLGIPATTFGLYLGAKAHTREEYLEIATLRPGLKIGLLILSQSFT